MKKRVILLLTTVLSIALISSVGIGLYSYFNYKDIHKQESSIHNSLNAKHEKSKKLSVKVNNNQ